METGLLAGFAIVDCLCMFTALVQQLPSVAVAVFTSALIADALPFANGVGKKAVAMSVELMNPTTPAYHQVGGN